MKPTALLPAVFIVLTAGCANHPMPASEEALARQEIERAKAAQAYEYAPARIKAAEEKFFLAEQHIDRKEYLKAKYLLEKSRKDAEEAYAVAQSEETKALLDEVNAMLKELEASSRGS